MDVNLEEVIKETVSTLNELKQCHSCVFSNEHCNWCSENKIKIHPSQYGCRKYMTNEDAVRRLAEIEYEKYRKEIAKMVLDMNIMGYSINAASIMLEKIDKELERSYNSIKDKTEDSIKKHHESKRNRERLRKAYAQMKINAQDMRNTYDKYIEYFFAHQFIDEQGKYNGAESDKNLANSGVISKVIKVFVDRALDNEENANKIMDFMLSLQGSGIYDENDFNKMMIKN